MKLLPVKSILLVPRGDLDYLTFTTIAFPFSAERIHNK